MALACALVPSSSAAAAAEGGAIAPSSSGGTQYGAALKPAKARAVNRPVATLLGAPATVRADRRPSIRVRVDQKGQRRVSARLVVLRSPGNEPVARISLGWIRTGRTVKVAWPRNLTLPEGAYVVRLHAKDKHNHVLARRASTAGRATMTVTPPPAPAAAVGAAPSTPTPGAPAAPAPPVAAPPAGDGVFPVQGAYTLGEGFGVDRGDHRHEGQDLSAAAGTPVVAPTAGTVTVTSYQASGAGYYVVEQAADGRAFFFAHCRKDSVVVTPGQVVAAGTQLCQVGSTGRSSGPHLHFEIWVGGWRSSRDSRPVDPLPTLQAWAAR